MRSNQLGLEKSPYLLQHASQPVHWQAWGSEIFELAKKEDKLIFLSVGYSTCHWCHVMAHESFDDQGVADFLNQHFISVKLDREERPDVDQVYMQALHLMRGQGGWPLSVFLTPEGKAFFAGTYFPKHIFTGLLKQLADAWKSERPRIEEVAERIDAALRPAKVEEATSLALDANLLKVFLSSCVEVYDAEYGGFGSEPKFPPVEKLRLLLRMTNTNEGAPSAQTMCEYTLQAMAYGGIYDQLGGGFARYSTDAAWGTPHFEKMLYDNAQLASVYTEAFLRSSNSFYLRVAEETLEYVLRDLQNPEGGFFSAEDADSMRDGHLEEGAFYVWDYAELETALSQAELKLLEEQFQLSRTGNFEHGCSILRLGKNKAWEQRWDGALAAVRQKLLSLRAKRPRPLRDEKIVAGLNGLMLEALSLAFIATGAELYRNAAMRAFEFVRRELWQNGTLFRRYCQGERKFAATLEDYAYLIRGVLSLYKATQDSKVYQFAVELQAAQDKKLWSAERQTYLFSSDLTLPQLVTFYDDACPNPQAVSASNLIDLGYLTANPEYVQRAQKLVQLALSKEEAYWPAFASSIRSWHQLQIASGVVVHSDAEKFTNWFDLLKYSHFASLLWAKAEALCPGIAAASKTMREGEFHLCTLSGCGKPSSGPDALAELVRGTCR